MYAKIAKKTIIIAIVIWLIAMFLFPKETLAVNLMNAIPGLLFGWFYANCAGFGIVMFFKDHNGVGFPFMAVILSTVMCLPAFGTLILSLNDPSMFGFCFGAMASILLGSLIYDVIERENRTEE